MNRVMAAPITNRPSALKAALKAMARAPPLRKVKGTTGITAPSGEQQKRGDGRLPGRAAELVRVDAQLLARERVERGARGPARSCGERGRLVFVHAFRLVDQHQLLLFLLGGRLISSARLRSASGSVRATLHGDPFPERHRAGPGHEPRDAVSRMLRPASSAPATPITRLRFDTTRRWRRARRRAARCRRGTVPALDVGDSRVPPRPPGGERMRRAPGRRGYASARSPGQPAGHGLGLAVVSADPPLRCSQGAERRQDELRTEAVRQPREPARLRHSGRSSRPALAPMRVSCLRQYSACASSAAERRR